MYFIPSTVDLFVYESPQNREEGECYSKEQCFSLEALREIYKEHILLVLHRA